MYDTLENGIPTWDPVTLGGGDVCLHETRGFMNMPYTASHTRRGLVCSYSRGQSGMNPRVTAIY